MWRIEIQLTDVLRPSDTCQIGGRLEVFRGPDDSMRALDDGQVALRRGCLVNGELRELPFEGPVTIGEEDGEAVLLIPDCRLQLERWRSTDALLEISGVARCVVQEMRAPRILEGRWVADRSRDVTTKGRSAPLA